MQPDAIETKKQLRILEGILSCVQAGLESTNPNASQLCFVVSCTILSTISKPGGEYPEELGRINTLMLDLLVYYRQEKKLDKDAYLLMVTVVNIVVRVLCNTQRGELMR